MIGCIIQSILKKCKVEWQKMYFDDIILGMTVEVSIDAYNQNGELVLKDVTEAIVKCRVV